MKDRWTLFFFIMALTLAVPATALDSQTLGDEAVAAEARTQALARSAGRPTANQAGTPAPPLAYDLCPGDTHTLHHTVHVPPAPLQADVLLAFDTTGSMDEVISAAQESAIEIMSDLQTLLGDVRFGIIDFRDYAFFPFGKSDDWPYLLRQSLTYNEASVQDAIDELTSGGGHDPQEAYTRVLYEAHADEAIDWRSGVRRFIIVFGDSVSHDDDLNEGVPPPQPYRPGQAWKTGAYPPPHLDPGRDAVNGTSDDLDFQPVLANLGDQSITLLFVLTGLSGNLPFGLSTEDLLVYWRRWAGMTGPGGDARILEDAELLSATIESLVAAAIRPIDRLTLSVVPSQFDAWVTIEPAAYTDLTIPEAGLDREFEVTITVPLDTPAGDYTFDLVAEGDGIVYHRQSVTITVLDTCFATPTPTWEPLPTPKPRWRLFLPYVTKSR